MRCLIKIPRRYLICLSLSVAFSFFLPAFGFVSDSYATSGTCTINFSKTSTSYKYGVSDNIKNTCFNNSVVRYYFRFNSFTLNVTAGYSSETYKFTNFPGSGNQDPFYYFYNYRFTNATLPASFSVSSSDIGYFNTFTNYNAINFADGSSSTFTYYDSIYIYTSSYSSLFSGTIVLDYTDDLSSWFPSSDCEPCPEVTPCPPIPENPYDNKLDDIKKAIYTASAVMIMIYFFFIVYKIIVKDGGRR